jgi:hypothetical protein
MSDVGWIYREYLILSEAQYVAAERTASVGSVKLGGVPARAYTEYALQFECVSREAWRKQWRSMPDYDGPTMRAPSGVQFNYRFMDDGFGTLQLPLRVYRERGDWHNHIEGLEPSQYPNFERKREDGSTVGANWWWETALELSRFDPPSKGGRGWCPKLAGVE